MSFSEIDIDEIYKKEKVMALEFEKGGIFKRPQCPKCEKPFAMHHIARAKGQRKAIKWRCSCGKSQSMFDGTIFGNRKKPFYDMVQFIKCWSLVMTLAKAIQLLQFESISACRQTLGDFYSSLRNVCSLALDKKNLKLGGEGQIVEIDENLFPRVKHKIEKKIV